MEGGVPTSALEGEENAVLTSRQMALTKAASPRFTTPDQTHYDVAVPTNDLDMHTLVYFAYTAMFYSAKHLSEGKKIVKITSGKTNI